MSFVWKQAPEGPILVPGLCFTIAVGDTRCEGNGVAEGIGGIEIERQALGVTMPTMNSMPTTTAAMMQNTPPVNFFLEEDRRRIVSESALCK